MSTPRRQFAPQLPFIGRNAELVAALDVASMVEQGHQSRLLVVAGDSGVGKSRFVNEFVSSCAKRDSESLCLYFDLSADEFASSHLFESLVCLAWHPRIPAIGVPLCVPPGADFKSFSKHKQVKHLVGKHLLAAMAKTIALVPYVGSVVHELVPELKDDRVPEYLPGVAMVFYAYLERVSRDHCVLLALDNYQFLARSLRLLLETRLQALDRNILFCCVDRTNEGRSSIDLPACYRGRQHTILLSPFSRQEVGRLVHAVISDSDPQRERVANDSYLKSAGNAKELEFYIRSLPSDPDDQLSLDGLSTFLRTVAQLPHLERCLLAISSMFPAGIRIPYALRAVGRLTAGAATADLEETIRNLAAVGYLTVNSESGELLKPAHEKVVVAIRAAIDDDEFLDIRDSVITTFDELLRGDLDRYEYSYLLHCLIGILNFTEISTRLDSFANLVDVQHRNENFHYLVSLYRHFPDVIVYLPEAIAFQLLDALQKTSEFYAGMDAVARLLRAGARDSTTLKLFAAKYAVQTYRDDDALRILAGAPETNEVALCRLNALQCMGRDDEARETIERVRARHIIDDAYHIIMRNSAHLYGFRQAREQLLTALRYFERRGSLYKQATVLNNLGLLSLWNDDAEGARRQLLESCELHQSIASSEVYQPLINLGVLDFIGGNLDAARESFGRSRRWLPKTLLLDEIVLEIDLALVDLAAGSLSIDAIVDRLHTFYRQALATDDPRLQDQIAYTASRLAAQAGRPSELAPSGAFVLLVEDRQITGFEVVKEIDVGGGRLRVLAILSPHWRH